MDPNTYPPLSSQIARDVLDLLGAPAAPPSVRNLNRLIGAYVRHVPWESVFRIIKRNATLQTADCPRLPEEFWHDALTRGGGGTCYENNFAFLSLLRTLGYDGYMTVNDMGERRGVHAAVVIQLVRPYLVDVSIPIPVAIPLDPHRVIRRSAGLHTFVIRPAGVHCYQVERTRHPRRNAYTLRDIAVTDSEFVQVIENDYADSGQFLDTVIIVKMLGDELVRFTAGHEPPVLELFNGHGKHIELLPSERLVEGLAERFGIQAEQVAAALALTGMRS